MAEVTVEFIGMCTHVLCAIDGWQHRVVLPRPMRSRVPEHQARLCIPSGAATEQDIDAFVAGSQGSITREPGSDECEYVLGLRGVALEVANTTGDFTRDWKFLCGVFRLQDFTGAEDLPPIDPVVWNGWHRARANAYFNVSCGTFSARLYGQSSAAVLTMTTANTSPTLVATLFNGKTATLAVKDRAVLQVTHTNPSCDLEDSHFVMHFELAERMPRGPQVPKNRARCLDGPGQGLSVGCSNTTFP